MENRQDLDCGHRLLVTHPLSYAMSVEQAEPVVVTDVNLNRPNSMHDHQMMEFSGARSDQLRIA